jgi:uncharacterized membrane protein
VSPQLLFGPFFMLAGVMHFVIAALLRGDRVHMALHPDRYRVPGGRIAVWLRLPVQALFIAWAIAAGRARPVES